ncbi:hypothetical protein [Streptomyces sp. H27-C3]|uniref:hypothetical protein n=1 Tax=Streptomyces sp. H27-C3 TaxID=3046305 RepID=UPI0024BA67E0|nr:hypothetical protein [Streptomyces sp. H27-C3]MDJ0461562.1 hypothetical protein [Streptomyces sp. H27-C3]
MDRAKAAVALAGAAGWIVARLPGVAGAVLVSAAGWMVFEPAGLFLAGAFCLAADWRGAR